MVKAFESFEEFEKSYRFYMSDEGGGVYYMWRYSYPKRSTFDRLFNRKRYLEKYNESHKDPDDGLCYSSDAYYLARVTDMRCLCHRIQEVDIDLIDQDGDQRCLRIKPDYLYHVDWGKHADEFIARFNEKDKDYIYIPR